MNTWTDPPCAYTRQTVDRIPVLAYLDENTPVEVSALVVNGFLVDMDLRGFSKQSFNDLETDVKEALRLYGYAYTGRDSVEIDYNF